MNSTKAETAKTPIDNTHGEWLSVSCYVVLDMKQTLGIPDSCGWEIALQAVPTVTKPGEPIKTYFTGRKQAKKQKDC